MAKNVFVVGLDAFNLSQLQSLKNAKEYQYHSLISYKDIKTQSEFPVRSFLRQSTKTLQDFKGSIDAIVGYWDFPVSTVLPIVREPYHLPGPSLEAVLKCEHKYWSRVIEADVVPEYIPAFDKVNPFSDNAIKDCQLEYPFWLKPVKGVLSYLGFHIHNQQEFEKSLQLIRQNITRYAEPFNYILAQAKLPSEIVTVDGSYCIAESIISEGRQCTLEGYVYQDDVQIYGIVDSIREGKHSSSFARYQYPSSLPKHITLRMGEVMSKVLKRMEYNNAPFNAEFYWDSNNDNIWLLEINTRISKSHCPLFKMVDGEYHHAVNIDLALGNKPDFPHRQGQYNVAAKFMLRHYRDGIVKKIPTPDQINDVTQRFPDISVLFHVKPGMRLSEMRDQDSYSYELAVFFIGADSQEELIRKYSIVQQMLPFGINESEE